MIAIYSKKFSMVTMNGEDKSDELRAFADFIGLERVAPGRYSTLLILHLWAACASGRLNPARVIREIRALEGTGDLSHTKPPLPFKHPPLKGLWHKHYQASGLSSVARNLLNGLQKNSLPAFKERIREMTAAGEERYLEAEDIELIVQDAVVDNWIRRTSAAEMTGEWIIYAEHKGEKYYLCLGEHKEAHDHLRSQIATISFHEFSFLTELLGE